jgi:hypothetical protein
MPKRVIDFDAMWGSDKLAACAEWAQAEYAWLYGLADASGCFELTNLRVIWGRVAAIRRNLTIERLEQIFNEFQDKGLLFVWEHQGKQYGHWTGSDVPGRLPPPSWRMRLERFAPPVPKQQLAEYVARFSRGRAALASAETLAAGAKGNVPGNERDETAELQGNFKFEISNLEQGRCDGARGSGLKASVEATQAQDLDLNWNENWEKEARKATAEDPVKGLTCREAAHLREEANKKDFSSLNSTANSNANSHSHAGTTPNKIPHSESAFRAAAAAGFSANANAPYRSGMYARMDYKALLVERELRVGQGPVCSPAMVRPEVLERIRKRDAARAGSRSP